MITNAHYLEHTNTIFHELGILKLADINKYISSVFMYKYENKYLPKCFVGTFTKNQEVHHHNARFAHHYKTIKYKSDKMKYSITVKGPKLWKEIPQKINLELFITTYVKKINKATVT